MCVCVCVVVVVSVYLLTIVNSQCVNLECSCLYHQIEMAPVTIPIIKHSWHHLVIFRRY